MPKGFRTGHSEEQQVIALAKTPLTQEEIARKVGVSRRTVGRIWKEAGISREEERIPVETTGRRRKPKEVADVELGPHSRELFYFGQRLRDRLSLEMPHKMAGSGSKAAPTPMWRSSGADTPKDAEEESVEREWRSKVYDVRTHSVFPLFRQHLAKHQCWAALEKLKDAFEGYRTACQKARQTVTKEAKGRLLAITGQQVTTAEQQALEMADSLLLDAYYLVTGSEESSFSYEPRKTPDGDKLWWHLELGAWRVGRAENPAALQPLALVHQELCKALPSMRSFKRLAKAVRAAEQAIEEFKGTLSPDALLRKLLLKGRCDQCP